MTTVSSTDIRLACANERLPLLQQLFTQLAGLTAGNTTHLFGCGRGGDARITITPGTIERQLDEMVSIERMGGNIRFCAERLLLALTRQAYPGIVYTN